MKRFYTLFILLLISLAAVHAAPGIDEPKEPQLSPMRVWFDTWHKNRLRYNSYNDSIFIRSERQEWVNLCIRRAEAYREMFQENQKSIDAFHAHFGRPAEEIPVADYDTLFSLCETDGKGIDVFMASDFMTILEQYFASHHDTPENLLNYLTSLYYQASFHYQFDFLVGHNHMAESYSTLSRLLSFVDDPAVSQYRDLQVRMLLGWGMFALLGNNYVSADIITQAASDNIVNDIRARLEMPEWQWIGEFVSGEPKSVFLPLAKDSLDKDDFRLLARYYGFIQSYKGETTEKVDYETLYKNKPAKLTLERWKENCITADQAMLVLDSLHQAHGDSVPPREDLIAAGLSDALLEMQLLSMIIDKTSLSTAERQERAREAYRYFYQVMLACQGRNDIRNASTLEDLVQNSHLLPYLSREEHLNLLNKVMLTLQVNTYAHSTHLRTLVMTLLKGVIKQRPDLLVGMPGCGSVDEVQAKSDSLLNFIGQAALFHDLGKNSMGSVVTNDFRRLYDEEFDILKSHPERGIKYLGIDSTFQIYNDITLGHHLWYDGTKGYPMTFNIRESPVRIMIDIVTICDCLEAATDAVGRNYNPLKIFQTLMEEFDEGAGTRYNPDIIQIIHDDSVLWHELEQYVTPQGCYSNYYDIYRQFFTE